MSIHVTPKASTASLEVPPYNMQLFGSMRQGRTLEPIKVYFKGSKLYAEIPRGFNTDFSSIPSFAVMASSVLLAYALALLVHPYAGLGLLTAVSLTLVMLPRGSLFPAGVVHDAFYQGCVNWYLSNPKHEKRVMIERTKIYVSRAFADDLYRHFIVSYGGSRAKGLLYLPRRFGARCYWLALRIFGRWNWYGGWKHYK